MVRRLAFLLIHSQRRTRYYLSEQQPDEALLLKCFDSASIVGETTTDVASLTPHTGFVDDAYKGRTDVEPRQSIEVRALVYSK
jgi:fructosamine-3-kinase